MYLLWTLPIRACSSCGTFECGVPAIQVSLCVYVYIYVNAHIDAWPCCSPPLMRGSRSAGRPVRVWIHTWIYEHVYARYCCSPPLVRGSHSASRSGLYIYVNVWAYIYIYKYIYTYALGVPRRNFDVVYHDEFSKIHRVQGLEPISIPLFWVARATERAATGRFLNAIRDAVQEARKYG